MSGRLFSQLQYSAPATSGRGHVVASNICQGMDFWGLVSSPGGRQDLNLIHASIHYELPVFIPLTMPFFWFATSLSFILPELIFLFLLQEVALHLNPAASRLNGIHMLAPGTTWFSALLPQFFLLWAWKPRKTLGSSCQAVELGQVLLCYTWGGWWALKICLSSWDA